MLSIVVAEITIFTNLDILVAYIAPGVKFIIAIVSLYMSEAIAPPPVILTRIRAWPKIAAYPESAPGFVLLGRFPEHIIETGY